MTDLSQAVREAGVVGAGGAGFPTHIKLNGRPRVLIVNGAECEPLLRADQELLAREQDILAFGLAELVRWLNPEETYLAVKGKHKTIVSDWKKISSSLPVKIFELKDFYPAGDEHVLINQVTGMVVPPGGIPLDTGALVLNVETLLNVARAAEGRPVTEKYVTVTGAVAEPKTFRVPVGISIRELVGMAGEVVEEDTVLLEGGPMMGRLVEDRELPVTKTTKGIIVLPASHRIALGMTLGWPSVQRRNRNSCENCRMCTDLCPRSLLGHPLEVHRIMRYHCLDDGRIAPHEYIEALLCSECGLCERFSCPVGIFPRAVMVRKKRELVAAGARYPRGQGLKEIPSSREERMVPSNRLIARLGLGKYDKPAPLEPRKVVPPAVRIPLKPPFGVPCEPCVENGQRVDEGDLIGEIPEGAMGSRIHASIGGTVTGVTPDYVQIQSGKVGVAV